MTKQEIEAKIKQLESDQFLLNMKDGWDGNDFSKDAWYTSNIEMLKQKLAGGNYEVYEYRCMGI